ADGGEDVGVVTADIDPAMASEARRKIPSLTHDRPFD
ncbi:MAG: carbon-nitrogen hydrolase family protein, partial [Proteobacteria bacterium]|nr:carbon-nitrogen hydrolase family protein [Pseudomonadota bacterium]